MNFNLVEMYNGLLRFNKHILNELAEGLKHLPNLDGVSKGDSLIINEQGNPAWVLLHLFLLLKMLLMVLNGLKMIMM
nr:MAG: hypothetical protein [Bacteriophage sp.]